ncbi:MAG: hypothetical protein ACHQ2F_01085 [Desulfobaccales bacterium]
MQLKGQSAICNFLGRPWSRVEELILTEQFPAQRIEGVWQADIEEITAWRLSHPEALLSKTQPCPSYPDYPPDYDWGSTKDVFQMPNPGGFGSPGRRQGH